MPGPYPRPSHTSGFNDGSSTDATVLMGELETSVEELEGSVATPVPNAAQALTNLGAESSAHASATYATLGGVVAGPHFDHISGAPATVPLTSRLTDALGNVVSGQIVAKPAGEGSEALIDWSHGDSTGYLFHLLDATGMTGPGLIGIGIQNGGTGLVMAKHGPGLLMSVATDAATSGSAMQWANLGSGTLLYATQGSSGTPGSLIVLQGYSGAPAASRVLSIQNTLGDEFGYFDASTMKFHLVSGSHDLTYDLGSGPNQQMYVYTGSPGLWWANYIQANTNHLLIRSATGPAAKGSETVNTMIDISTGNTMGFFGSTGTTKPTVAGAKGGNAALASLLTALAGLGLVTDTTTA